jgi:hypothetical protein
MFGCSQGSREWPTPPHIAPPEDVIDCLVEDRRGVAEPVRWSEYLPDGMLADLLAQPTETDPEHREFEALERIGRWERIIAWTRVATTPPPRTPPGSSTAGVSAGNVDAVTVRMYKLPFPTPRCSATTTSRASSLATDQTLPPLLAIFEDAANEIGERHRHR